MMTCKHNFQGMEGSICPLCPRPSDPVKNARGRIRALVAKRMNEAADKAFNATEGTFEAREETAVVSAMRDLLNDIDTQQQGLGER